MPGTCALPELQICKLGCCIGRVRLRRFCLNRYAHNGPLIEPGSFSIPGLIFQAKVTKFGRNIGLNMFINISPGFYHNHQKKWLIFYALSNFAHWKSIIFLRSFWKMASTFIGLRSLTNSRLPFRVSHFAKMGTGMVYALVGSVCVCACGKFAGLQPDSAIRERSYCRSLREALLSWPMLESVRTSGRIIAEVEEQYLLIKDFNNEIWKR